MSNSKQHIVTRFAPSPTGLFHVGSYRTALFNYLFAKKHNGKLILRIEDTDKERSKKEFEENIYESFKWLGITFNETYRQSEQIASHTKHLKQLIADGYAYISKEEIVKEGGRSEVIRFKNPNTTITFTDLIRGDISFDTTDLGDFVIAKSIEEPLFHLAVVVDDYEEGVTHIIRGEDHISNTPRQILIRRALGAPEAIYAHIPLVLAPDRSKLSKRHGAKPVTEYKERGFFPEAVLNYMALLGWNPGTGQEIFSLAELVEVFDISKVQKGGAIFSEEKLRWFNREHLRKLPLNEIKTEILSQIKNNTEIIKNNWTIENDVFDRLLPIIEERIYTLHDVDTLINEGDFDYVFTQPEYDIKKIHWKKEEDLTNTTHYLSEIVTKLNTINSQSFTQTAIKEALWSFAEEKGKGNVLWPMRYALSGKDRSPDPFQLAELLGKDETLQRLQKAIQSL